MYLSVNRHGRQTVLLWDWHNHRLRYYYWYAGLAAMVVTCAAIFILMASCLNVRLAVKPATTAGRGDRTWRIDLSAGSVMSRLLRTDILMQTLHALLP